MTSSFPPSAETATVPPRPSAIPAPNEIFDVHLSDGAIVRLRRHGRPQGRRLVLSHGNGLAIDGYFAFWRHLLNDFDVILLDMRNHGQNPPHPAGEHSWPRFVLDIEELCPAIDAAFGDKPKTGLFHSLSAIASVLHMSRFPGRWQSLILFDPPICPPDGHALRPLEDVHMHELTARALRRPQAYEAPEQLAGQFLKRPEFSRWSQGVAQQIADATLRYDDGERKWVLCCPREYEAEIYRTNRDMAVWRTLSGPLTTPVAIIAADPRLEDQPPPARVCASLAETAGIPYRNIPDTTHFLQVERPELCIEAALEFLARTA